MESKGWEFEFGGDIIHSKDFTWTTNMNLSHNSGKILSQWGNNTYYNGNGFVAPGTPGDAARIEEGSGSNNGIRLIPSFDPLDNKYPYKLGGAYSKFHDSDIRKQPYVYESNGKYRGMFIVGKLINPTNPDWVCTGSREYNGQIITVVDQVSYFAKLGSAEYPTLASLPSTIATAEESSCVRVTKRSPRPNQSEKNRKFDPDVPIIRLAEIYYTLAECKMRAGEKGEAAQLINRLFGI